MALKPATRVVVFFRLPDKRNGCTFRSHFNRHPNDSNIIQNLPIQAVHSVDLGSLYQFLRVLLINSHVLFIFNRSMQIFQRSRFRPHRIKIRSSVTDSASNFFFISFYYHFTTTTTPPPFFFPPPTISKI